MSVEATTAVWKHSESRGSSLIVLLRLANRSDEHGLSYEGVETIARFARMGVRNTQYRLQELVKRGELEIQYGASPYGTNLYQILLPDLVDKGVQSPAPGATQRQEGVQNSVSKLHPRSNEKSDKKTLGAKQRNPDCPDCGGRSYNCLRCARYSGVAR